MIRTVVVDDHRLFADGLASALNSLPDQWVVAIFYDGRDLVDSFDASQTDVVIVDLEMPILGGIEVLDALGSDIPIIVVSMHTGENEQRLAFDLGARAFLPKSAPLSDLAAAIRAVYAGRTLTDSATFREILDNYTKPYLDPGAESLTNRELEILRLLASGITATDELADRLFISQKTVKNHLASIFAKLAVSDRAQAAVEAIRLGLNRE